MISHTEEILIVLCALYFIAQFLHGTLVGRQHVYTCVNGIHRCVQVNTCNYTAG